MIGEEDGVKEEAANRARKRGAVRDGRESKMIEAVSSKGVLLLLLHGFSSTYKVEIKKEITGI